MENDGVEIIIDQAAENRRFRLRGVVIIFLAVLFTTSIAFAVAAVSVNNLFSNATEKKQELSDSSDEMQDIRYTLVNGELKKEYLSEEEVAEEIAKEKAEEEKEKEEVKKAEEEKKAAEEKAKQAQQTQQAALLAAQGNKIVYLTFDDGPGPYTEKLLNVLKKYNVKVTFFVTCNRAQYRNMIKRAYSEGHAIGLHTCSHDYAKVYKSEEAYFKDLNSVSSMVQKLISVETKLVRFPGGSSNTVSKRYSKGIMTKLAKLLKEQGYVYFDWSVASGDAGGTTSTNGVYRNVINGINRKPAGSSVVILQHDIKGFSVDAVEKIIKYGLKHNYTFLPLNENSPTAHQRIAN